MTHILCMYVTLIISAFQESHTLEERAFNLAKGHTLPLSERIWTLGRLMFAHLAPYVPPTALRGHILAQ